MCVIFIKTHVFITDLVSFSEGGGVWTKSYIVLIWKKLLLFLIVDLHYKP